MTKIRVPTDFVIHVENTLGWQPIPELGRRQALAIEVGRLNKRIATDPDLFTWDNLLLAVELLRRKRFTVSPTGVCGWVKAALAAAAHQDTTSDLAGEIHTAIAEAFVAGETEWVERLSRAIGDARTDVLAEWKASRV